jgi:carbamoyltransferase
VALFIWHQLLDEPRPSADQDRQQGSLLGPRFTDDELATFLDEQGATYHRFDDEPALCEHVAALLADEQVVGWFQGRMEFGPRALGSRSIIGDPRSQNMQSVMNRKIKFRESFRPFAPSVLQDRVSEYFDMAESQDSPYMLLVAPVQDSMRLPDTGDATIEGLAKLQVPRSTVPAITHVDYSARVQTVDARRHGRYHSLLRAFERHTRCPMLINTSFNVRGEPIVCQPEQAYRCFMATNMDVLVLEGFVLLKQDQPDAAPATEEYLAQFSLD